MNEQNKAHHIIRHLVENGWEAYIVGGAVRDIVLNHPPKDIDIVTSAPQPIITELFKGHKRAVVGASHSVCLVDGIEVSTYRKEAIFDPLQKVALSHEACSLKEDLARRDFTMNALAYDPNTDTIIDEFGGISDIKNRIIRFTLHPEDRILEDPCRMIRAARFVARLDARIDGASKSAMIKNNHLVEKVAPERVRLEILKAMEADQPSFFFDTLYDVGLLKWVIPDFQALYGHDGGPYHNETLDVHAKLVGDGLTKKKPLLRLAGYLHDVGKVPSACTKKGTLSFPAHEKIGAEMVEKTLKRLKFSLKETKYVKGLIYHHMRVMTPSEKARSIRRTLKALSEDQIPWKDWLCLRLADKRGNLKATPYTREMIRKMVLSITRQIRPKDAPAAFSVKDLAVTGKDVITHFRIDQGPIVGRLLKSALELVLDDPEKNRADILMDHMKKELDQ